MKSLGGRLLPVALTFLLGATVVWAQQSLTIKILIQNADQYDGRVVTVAGTVGDYRERKSNAGNPYTTFRLTDGPASVGVFVWNHRGLSDGQKVRVTGTFEKVKRVGAYTFGNEIEANLVEVQK